MHFKRGGPTAPGPWALGLRGPLVSWGFASRLQSFYPGISRWARWISSVVQKGFQVICLRASELDRDCEETEEREESVSALVLRVWCHVSVLVKQTSAVFWLMEGPQGD
eukprot:4508197-Pyramimonas_sp.AAC.1